MTDTLRCGIIVGSTRPGRLGASVASWVAKGFEGRPDIEARVLDLRDFDIPYYEHDKPASRLPDEELPHPWAREIKRCDCFIVVAPEYNHGFPAVLKSALDAVYHPWVRKPMAIASYGGWSGGSRAAEQLRLVACELQMAPVRSAVVIQFAYNHFDAEGGAKEMDATLPSLTAMIDDLVWWGSALKDARERVPVGSPA